MRQELKLNETYFWGLTKEDLVATPDLVKSFMRAYWNVSKIPKEAKLMTPEMDLYQEVHYREMQLLIQFGIWRLQSIFESLLRSEFEVKTKSGLRDILKKMQKIGYTIIKIDELQEWASLRNHFSHSAPEIYHPCPNNLVEQDLDDFSTLLIEIFKDLETQRKSKAK